MARIIGRPFNYDYKRSGGGIPNPPPRNSGGSEPNTLGALNGVPQFFRKDQFKDGIRNRFAVSRGIPTELNRIDSIRNFGESIGQVSNASPNTPIYTYQAHFDPVVARFKTGSNRRDRQLYKRRRAQHNAVNNKLIVDRPFN
tara:strand:- start:4685 stop:5110 length:426 start_codon:yes stop_codon:yes gene_type:complete